MLTDYEVFIDEYNNNESFRESFDDYVKSLNVSSSAVSSGFDDGTTQESVETEQTEKEESETQTETIVVYDTTDYSDQLNGLISNTYFIVYFLFAFFVIGALMLVIKFFKSFF